MTELQVSFLLPFSGWSNKITMKMDAIDPWDVCVYLQDYVRQRTGKFAALYFTM